MASKAYDRAMKQIESPSETQLAEMIMRDIAQLSENAQGARATNCHNNGLLCIDTQRG